MANLCGRWLNRVFVPDTDDESDDNTHGYLRLKCTDEIKSTSLTTDVTTCESIEDVYLTPANSYQRSHVSAPQEQHCGQARKTNILKMIHHGIQHILHSTWVWCQRGTLTFTPYGGPVLMISPNLRNEVPIAV